jgi:hypothetical protein
MKNLLLAVLFLLGGGLARAADDFWTQLTPAERAAAGIDQLTEQQQAALNVLAGRFAKEGATHTIQAALDRARAEGAAVAKAEAKAEEKKQKIANAGLAVRDDDETIRTRIAGEFRGWTGSTTFQLENGQTWQQTDRENRFFPKMVNPEVELVPSKMAGWKMTLVSEGLWIRVKRIR